VPAARADELEPLRQAAETVVAKVPGVSVVTDVLTSEAVRGAAAYGAKVPVSARVAQARARSEGTAPPAGQAQGHSHAQSAKPMAPVPGVKALIAVASGKGGVGKSTTAVKLALGHQATGLKVGILDADIYGPSQPRLLGLKGQPQVLQGKTLKPMAGYGLKAMSMGFMVDEETPVIWRGPMVVGALNQMLRDVAWGEDGDLDVLVVDMPPGTGDVQLTMAQQVPLSGAIIVSTPQDLALIDARKGLAMFRKVGVPVLGIVENMSYYICPKCGDRADIFGHGGARKEADKLGIDFLGEIPLDIAIRETSDGGNPIVVSQPESAHAKAYMEIAKKVLAKLGAGSQQRAAPKIVVQ
jgi:ATP-binding protein involved in chromosome partitioning